MRFHLRTLLIFIALGPPLLAAWWWTGVAWSKHPGGLISFMITSLGVFVTALGAFFKTESLITRQEPPTAGL